MDVEGPSSGDPEVTVDELLVAPFSTRSQADRERIVAGGRPVRRLDVSHSVLLGKSIMKLGGGLHVFDTYDWLTASVTTWKFHCWPCLLFRPPGVLNETGILSFGQLNEHEERPEHLESLFRLQVLASQVSKPAVPDNTNRETFRRLADVLCSFVELQRAPQADRCLETLAFLRKYDAVDKRHSDDAIRLLRERPEVLEGVARAVAKVARRGVAREVLACQYVSLVLGRHPGGKASSVLRYVRNGRVEERFLGFSRLSGGSAPVYKHVKRLVEELGIGSKCVALSLDGGLVDPARWDCLLANLRMDAPHCTFAPCHSHPVDSVWRQSLSAADPRCRKFFRCLSALEGRFQNSADLRAAMDDFAPETGLRDALGARPTPDFLSYVHRSRPQLAEFFDAVLSDGTRWDADLLTAAVGCREFLLDGTTQFLLDVFAKMFKLAAPLKTALGGYVPERRFGEGTVSHLIGELRSMQSQGCASLLAGLEPGPEKNDCIRLFDCVLRRAIAEVQKRYGDLEKFRFCCLFDFLEEGWYSQSPKYLKDFQKHYGLDFDLRLAQSELAVLESHGAFSKTSVYDFHQHLHDSHLKHTFRSLFDFSELVLALPFKHTSLERETSVWDKISRWCASPVCAEASDDLSFLFVESDYLREVKKTPSFYREVCAESAKS